MIKSEILLKSDTPWLLKAEGNFNDIEDKLKNITGEKKVAVCLLWMGIK